MKYWTAKIFSSFFICRTSVPLPIKELSSNGPERGELLDVLSGNWEDTSLFNISQRPESQLYDSLEELYEKELKNFPKYLQDHLI